jgi:hypothetical protein
LRREIDHRTALRSANGNRSGSASLNPPLQPAGSEISQ